MKKNTYAWTVVFLLWMVCVLNYADRQVLSGVFPALEKEFGFSKFQLGMIGSMFMWMYASCAVFMGFVSDRVNRKKLIVGGCFLWSLITMGTGWSTLFWQFLLVRGLEGVGESCYFPSSTSLIADYHPQEKRSLALSIHHSGIFFGAILGSSLGGWLAQHYRWSYGFYFFGGLGVMLSFVLFFFLNEPPRLTLAVKEARKPLLTAWCVLLKRTEMLLMILAFICVNIVAMTLLTWMPTFLYEKFHISLAQAGFFAVIFIQLSGACIAPFSGWSGDKLSSKIRHGRLSLQILALFIGALAIICIGQASTLPVLFAMMSLFGLCKGGYDVSIFATLYDYVEPELRGTAAGLLISCGYFGGALGPLLLGAVATYGGVTSAVVNRMSWTLSVNGLAYFLGALLLLGVPLVLKRPKNIVPMTTK